MFICICTSQRKKREREKEKHKLSFQSKSEREKFKEEEEEGFSPRVNKLELGKMLQTEQQAQPLPQPHQQNQLTVQNSGNLSFSSHLSKEDEEISRSALTTFRAKEEEIERKKLEVREKVQLQLARVEEDTKRLAMIRDELEALADPMRKDVSLVRKKIDAVNKELKPLGSTCQKKEREYKEALEAFNEKNKEKVQLITRLMELVGESERLRMKKLEELSKNIDSIH
ncbi:hypothetical protein PTKIN_Ptkin13bG0251600 [Pterospermum kingtungense]